MNLANFTDVLGDEICNSQPLSLPSSGERSECMPLSNTRPSPAKPRVITRPPKGTGQRGQLRSVDEIDPKYRDVFTYKYFNLVQSRVIEDAIYSDKSIVVCAPTGSGKTVVFEMAIVQLLMELEDKQYDEDFKIIYMAPVKALCTERLTEWYPKFNKLGLLCIEVTGDTDVDFTQLKPYKIIITTPEKWDMLTRRWRDHRGLVEVIKLFLIDEVHILNDELRGPVLEAVVSRMKTIESSAQSVHRIEQLQKGLKGEVVSNKSPPRIRFVAVSATVSNPEDVASWLGSTHKPAVFHKFGDECRPVKLKRIVEGYPCPEGSSIFKFDIILNYKLWPVIQKYHSGKPTLIFCNTRKSVILTAETLSRELTISFNAEQRAKLTAVASTIKNKKLQALVMSGVGCHHAGLLYEERQNIEFAFRNRDLPILITTTTLAMGVNLPAHLVIVKNTQQYVNGAYQEYSISTVLQMVGRAGRPQFDTEATAVIMTRLVDKPRYQALVGGCEPLQSFLHKRLPENLNSEAALGTVGDVAQCVQWLRSTFLYIRAARDPKKYLGLPQNSPQHLISKKIEELCVKAMNGLASSGLITMDEASCIASTEAGRLMSIFYLDLETMKNIMKIEGSESLERLLAIICESHELADMHLRVDERRCLNTLNRNNAAPSIRFPMKGKISTRQMKLNCVIQAVLGCLSIPDPSLNQEAMKIMRIADRVCKCLVTYVTRADPNTIHPQFYSAVLNSIILAKCVSAHLWENSPFVSKQLKGIGPTFSALLASAGKVNFMLLEESHPRDLERIMNKGAPAGNILRKQISLLPKYQLTMTPVDDKIVNIQLQLLNQAFLSENIDNLTAGDSHKFYVIVGDSSNHLLIFASYKDKDLISVFNGTITHEVRRKHNFEHKIFAHCISSSFVGIDVQSEYTFNNLEQHVISCPETPKTAALMKKCTERQTCITDTFKERKRKSVDPIDKTQSKEKRKRESALIENFKSLKDSFLSASKNIKRNLYTSSKDDEVLANNVQDTNMVSRNIDDISNAPTVLNNLINESVNIVRAQNDSMDDIDNDEFIDDEKIDSLLSEIESEMCKNRGTSAIASTSVNNNNSYTGHRSFNLPKQSYYNQARKCKPVATKSNYTFIDLIEKNSSKGDEENNTCISHRDNGFSDTIKTHIQKYLTNTRIIAQPSDRKLELLLNSTASNQDVSISGQENQLDDEIPASPTYRQYPKYEIKEILGNNDCVGQCNNSENVQKKSNIQFTTGKDTKEKSAQPYEINDEKNVYNEDESKENYKSTTLSENGANLSVGFETKLVTATKGKIPLVEDKPVMHITAFSRDNTSKTEDSTVDDTESNLLNLNIANLHLTTNVDPDCDENNIAMSKELVKSAKNDDLSAQNSTNKENNSNAMSLMPTENKLLRYIPLEYKDDSKTLTLKNVYSCSNVNPSYSINGNNRFIPNNLLIDEGNTHLNQAPTKANSYLDIKGLELPYNGQDSNHSPSGSKKGNEAEPKTEYVKKYHYSTSNIDTCIKHTSEYSVKVIKRVRLDMDVTEIVTRKQNLSSDKINSDYEDKNSEDIQVTAPVAHDRSYCQNLSRYFDTRETQNTYTQGRSEESDRPIRVFERQHTHGPTRVLAKTDHIKVKDLITCNDSNRNSTPTFNTNKNYLTETPIALENKGLLNSDERQDKASLSGTGGEADDNELKGTINEPASNENSVNNILQKYGRILGKTTTKIEPLECSGHNKTVKEGTYSKPKTTRPFKISDIHKLHATIPNTLLDDHKQEDKGKAKKIINECHFPERHETQLTNQSFQHSISQAENEDSKDEYISDSDLETFLLPEVDLDPSADFKIDQSMFDPKTLLKCVVNDNYCEELIPPPPEFCNGNTYVPGCDAVNLTIADSYECDNDGLFDKYHEKLENVENHDAANLSPSTNIETWNLSRNDSWDTYNSLNLTPVKSFTVMRRHPTNNIPRSSGISRRDKLGKFMFNKKVKLKRK
ncbi:unnamed protein product [Chrysodeixis includens]|uniref:DNA 3'-5' helicase n=1 Tax=Chrysodeixis includens TaxID=689277 RepID=A0A9P0BS68_CHRIL|nr:unnamed protein product [Chrysodeixis includens]